MPTGNAVFAGASKRVVLVAAAIVLASAVTAGAQVRSGVAVSGVVVDSTGGVLAGAKVELRRAGAASRPATTDGGGGFRFDQVPRGEYELVVTLEGFAPTDVHLTVGARAPRPLRITLPLAAVKQEIVVHSQGAQVNEAPANNADTVAVDRQMLDSLPVFDMDALATVSQFLDSAAIGSAGATIVVNGMEVNSLDVSASAIQQIRINRDPYSAEYSRPGRGRIEILTKPGSQVYHGELNGVFRDARLNGRNAFAEVRPPEQRRIVEGMLSGPVGTSRTTSFVVSADRDAEDQQAIVFALGPSGEIRGAAPQPSRHLLVSAAITHQRGASTTISVRPSYEEQFRVNRGAGGTTLGTAGINSRHREIDLSYEQQTVFGGSLLNQLRVLVGHELEPTTSASAAPGIVVDGAFTGGGAQVSVGRTELHLQMAESLTATRGRHLLQAGFQVPDWSRRGFDDRSDFGGTFSFSGLDAYAAGRPYSFVQQTGNGRIVWLEKVLGVYAKDDWQLSPHATVSFGLRYDWANYLPDHNNVAPRFSFALTPGDGKRITLRGGAGLFYDKMGPTPVIDVLQFRPGGLQRVVITNPGYPDPYQSAGGPAAVPPSIAEFAPDIRVPWTLQYSVGVEYQLLPGATLSVMYYGSDGTRFRSIDVNAPMPPLYAARPDPAFGVVRQIESSGRQRSDSLQVTLRGRVSRWFNGQAQYTLSRTRNDSGGLNWFPANDYALSGEWARADFDRRHRFVLLGRVRPGRLVDLGVGLNVRSGAPYSETLGGDPFNNGRGAARPAGVPRNSLSGAADVNVDLRVSRDFPFGGAPGQKRTVTLALDAFNVLNRVNDSDYVGTLGSPFFGQPVASDAPRRLQVSARVKF